MINTSTFDDLLVLYVYDELKEKRKRTIEKRILNDNNVLDSFVKLDSMVSELTKTKPRMSDSSIESILSYSKSMNAIRKRS